MHLRTLRFLFAFALAATPGCVQTINHAGDAGPDASAPDAASPSDAGPPVCSFGQDQTCNDDSTVSALWGHCNADGTCTCNVGFEIDPFTGHCHPVGSDGGSGYCTNGNGWTGPDGGPVTQPMGTCEGSACGIGCGCVLFSQNNPHCFCTGGLPPDGGELCIQPNCGVIWCDGPCACVDANTSQCWCPVSAPDGGGPDAGGNVCLFGQDNTCNDVDWANAIWGVCNANDTCTCHPGFVNDPATGRCEPAGGIPCAFSGLTESCSLNNCPSGQVCASDIACPGDGGACQTTPGAHDELCHNTCSPTAPTLECLPGEICTLVTANFDCSHLSAKWVCCGDGGC